MSDQADSRMPYQSGTTIGRMVHTCFLGDETRIPDAFHEFVDRYD